LGRWWPCALSPGRRGKIGRNTTYTNLRSFSRGSCGSFSAQRRLGLSVGAQGTTSCPKASHGGSLAACGVRFYRRLGHYVPDSRKTSHFGSLAPLRGGSAHWAHASLRVTPRSSSLLSKKISRKFTCFIDRKLV